MQYKKRKGDGIINLQTIIKDGREKSGDLNNSGNA